MALNLMRILQTTYEGITQQKLNRLARSGWNAAATALFGLGGGVSASWFLGSGWKPSADGSSLVVSMEPGLALQYSVTGDFFRHDYQPIIATGVRTATVQPNADASGFDRVDLVCVRAVDASGEALTVDTKNPISSAIEAMVLNQRVEYDSEILIVQGTPAASPLTPSTPSGWLAVAAVTVGNGNAFVAADGVEDVRATTPIAFNDLRPEILKAKDLQTAGQSIVASATFRHPGGSPARPFNMDIVASRNIDQIQVEAGADILTNISFTPAPDRPRSNAYAVLLQSGHDVNASTVYGRWQAGPFDQTGAYAQYINSAGSLAEPPSDVAAVHSVAIIDLTSL